MKQIIIDEELSTQRVIPYTTVQDNGKVLDVVWSTKDMEAASQVNTTGLAGLRFETIKAENEAGQTIQLLGEYNTVTSAKIVFSNESYSLRMSCMRRDA